MPRADELEAQRLNAALDVAADHWFACIGENVRARTKTRRIAAEFRSLQLEHNADRRVIAECQQHLYHAKQDILQTLTRTQQAQTVMDDIDRALGDRPQQMETRANKARSDYEEGAIRCKRDIADCSM